MWRSVHCSGGGRHARLPAAVVLAIFLNRYFPTIPPGTLAANLIGCYIIGMAIAFFTTYPHFAPEWRLFVTTGFCGGLTTFSTFSAEIVMLLQSGRDCLGARRRGGAFARFFVDDVRRHRHRRLAQGLAGAPQSPQLPGKPRPRHQSAHDRRGVFLAGFDHQ